MNGQTIDSSALLDAALKVAACKVCRGLLCQCERGHEWGYALATIWTQMTTCPECGGLPTALKGMWEPVLDTSKRSGDNSPAPCSVSFTRADVDVYIASLSYTDDGIASETPKHDKEDIIAFCEWLVKQNDKLKGGKPPRRTHESD